MTPLAALTLALICPLIWLIISGITEPRSFRRDDSARIWLMLCTAICGAGEASALMALRGMA